MGFDPEECLERSPRLAEVEDSKLLLTTVYHMNEYSAMKKLHTCDSRQGSRRTRAVPYFVEQDSFSSLNSATLTAGVQNRFRFQHPCVSRESH